MMVPRVSFPPRLSVRALGLLAFCSILPLAAKPHEMPARRIVVNIDSAAAPIDRFFDLSVGSDFPGTLIRADSQSQLKLVADELGFRYLRFHP